MKAFIAVTGSGYEPLLEYRSQERLDQTRRLPQVLQVDNGPEFISKALDAWAHRHGVKLSFSRLGTPTDTPYIEAFNGRFRAECLNQHRFMRQS